MDKKNSITVNNRSGAVQNYVLFAEAPSITPSDGEIHTNIIVAFRGVSGNSGEAFFTMPSERLFAICGTSNTEELENDIQIEITDKMPVNMGTQTETGSLIRGTTCDVTTSAGTPTFSAHQTAPPMGELGAFCIRTTDDFTYQNAEEGRYILGLGISTGLIREIGPFTVFKPSANEVYQIKPSNTFYLAVSDLETRAPVEPALKERACKIDF